MNYPDPRGRCCTIYSTDGRNKRHLHEGARLRNGATVVAAKLYSPHPDDMYLATVLAEYHGEYVTWLYNADSDGAGLGHYFGEDYAAAVESFAHRVHNPWR